MFQSLHYSPSPFLSLPPSLPLPPSSIPPHGSRIHVDVLCFKVNNSPLLRANITRSTVNHEIHAAFNSCGFKALPHYTFDPDRIRIESSYVASTLHPSECALSRSGSDPDKTQSTCRGGFKPDRIRISQFLRRRQQLSRALLIETGMARYLACR